MHRFSALIAYSIY